MDYSEEQKGNPNPIVNANFLSIFTMFYAIPTFRKGNKRDLEISDLYDTIEEHKSDRLGNQIQVGWEKELILARNAGRKPSLKRVLFRTYGLEIFKYGLLVACSELGIKILQPLALGQLLIYYQIGQDSVTKNQAWMYSSFVVFCSLANMFFVNKYSRGLVDLGMKMRVAFCSLIYRKALKLNKSTLGQTTIGQMVNLLSNDVNRFDYVNLLGTYVWISPVQTIIITWLMYRVVGYAAIIGICSLIIFVPLQIALGIRLAHFRSETAIRTDERIRLMNEIVTGIQVIKMYTWEKPFAKLVAFSRRFEIASVKKSSYALGVLSSLTMYTSRLALYVTVLSYALITDQVVAAKAFELTAFYTVLRQSLTVFFSQGIGRMAETNVSLNRLTEFMMFEESSTDLDKPQPELICNGKSKKVLSYDDELAVNLKHVTVKWSENAKEDTLFDINLPVRFGSMVGIVGPVGSGKSSLLYTILKELPLSSGKLIVNGKISYASQEPWIFPGTVRQNILFGLPFNNQRYKNVIRKCALLRDISLFPCGDKTIVGERGVTISGGQKARINLARAVYRDADVYLLDDPLSAVDTRVGKQLFENCICGFLKDKTVILVTHQLQYLRNIQNVVILKHGIIEAQGNLEHLQKSGVDFAELLKTDNKENIESDIDEFMHKQMVSYRRGSILSTMSMEESAQLLSEAGEHSSKGLMSNAIYKDYFTAGSHGLVAITVLSLFVIAQIAASSADYFLSHWVNSEETLHQEYAEELTMNKSHSLLIRTETSDYAKSIKYLFESAIHDSIRTYSIIIFITISVSVVRSFVYFAMCMRSSIALHDKMFDSIIRAPMQFFNVNQSGRILNRFSKDMGAIDELLPLNMIDFLQVSFTFFGVVVVIGIVNPWLLIPTVFFAVCFYLVRKGYILTSRSVKRLEGITRSPVFAYLSSSIQGLTTIRAFGNQNILEREFDGHQDLHSSAWFLYLVTSRALGFALDLLCVIYVAIVTFSFLIIGSDRYPGKVGLAITQAVGLAGVLQWGIKQSTEMENQMTSVERVLEYTKIDNESSFESLERNKPPASWPDKGRIKFENVYLRYFPENPPVLRNLNFTIQPLEKVGIVGRTGAGKSSLISALFRLVETDGSIIIDNVTIKQLGLHDLRSKISIIPQEPVLFTGSLRRNLDPFDEYTDEVLWNALAEVELKGVVSELHAGLSSLVSEGGSNFSVGQRQLVCLARALIRNNKILMLDEATANVDPQTDALIQLTIRKKFVNCTVLTIAHRLHTVMDSDKVLVMDAGRVLEFDHPYVLLQKTDGYLYGMVQQTGETMAKTLTNISRQSYNVLHPIEDLIKL